jgi:o-succinylbenzoate---CoA ligase
VTSRPLHAVLVSPAQPGAPLLDALPAALDGTGPALLPLDASLPRARLGALLEAFAPSVVLTSEGPERAAGAWSPGPADPGVHPEIALVIATSGSTGEPKGVELAGSALLASARASLRRIGAGRGGRWLCCLPAFHIAGIQVLVRSLLCGAAPAVPDHLDAAALAASGCAHVSLVPTQLRRLVDAGADLSALSSILLGGAAVPPGLVDAARDAGGRVITTYGMTETCGGCVYDGVPLDGVRADIRADGRIRIAGPVLFSGYRLRPDLTALAREDDWFVTSDLGAITPSGALVVRGRADDVINTGGELVVAAEVETVIGGCAGVREAAVVGVADPEWGERVTAVVVPADPAAPPRLDALRAHVRGVLPAYAAPGALVLAEEIPMLPSGKADKEALRARLS